MTVMKGTAFLAAIVAAATALFPAAAAAHPPTRVQAAMNDATDLPGLCPFDVIFTSSGTVTQTTYYDRSGTPTSGSIHGALTHTVVSRWHTLTSNGPAPVHVDLTTGEMIITGREFAFHLPGDGIVLGQAGRLIFAADGSVLSFAGNSVTDVADLCAALGP